MPLKEAPASVTKGANTPRLMSERRGIFKFKKARCQVPRFEGIHMVSLKGYTRETDGYI